MIDFVRNPSSDVGIGRLATVRLIVIAGGWHQRSKDQEALIRFSDPSFVLSAQEDKEGESGPELVVNGGSLNISGIAPDASNMRSQCPHECALEPPSG